MCKGFAGIPLKVPGYAGRASPERPGAAVLVNVRVPDRQSEVVLTHLGLFDRDGELLRAVVGRIVAVERDGPQLHHNRFPGRTGRFEGVPYPQPGAFVGVLDLYEVHLVEAGFPVISEQIGLFRRGHNVVLSLLAGIGHLLLRGWACDKPPPLVNNRRSNLTLTLR